MIMLAMRQKSNYSEKQRLARSILFYEENCTVGVQKVALHGCDFRFLYGLYCNFLCCDLVWHTNNEYKSKGYSSQQCQHNE